MNKLLITILIIVGFVFLSWYFFLFDKVVVEGKAYGFTIGMYKDDAVRVIKKEHGSQKNKIILSPDVRGNEINSIKRMNADEINTKHVNSMNVWQVRFNGKETNVLVLIFKNDKLIKLRRYRRAFIP